MGSGLRCERRARRREEAPQPETGAPSAEELREFLEAETSSPPADPHFRERLRRRLWRLVRNRYRRGQHLSD